MEIFFPEESARELVRAIRGKSSSSWLSQRLGYKFNKVARWERGAKTLLWSEFLALASLRRLDVSGALAVAQLIETDPKEIGSILEELIGSEKYETAARRADISAAILRRWISGATSVPLVGFLSFLHQYRRASADFVAHLVPIERVPSLCPLWKMQKQERELHARHPEAAAIIRALELGEYQRLSTHKDDLIARKAGCPIARVQRLLEGLEKVGSIRREGKKFKVVSSRLNLISAEQRAQIKRHWLQNAIRVFDALPESEKTGPGKNVFSYNVFSVSDPGWKKILMLYSDFYAALRVILEQDSPEGTDNIKVFTAQFVDLEVQAAYTGLSDN